MSQRAQTKDRSRRRIVEAAARLVREKGVSGTSVDGVMRAAGLTVGAFYAHFRNKDELVSVAFDRALDDVGKIMGAANAGETGKLGLLHVVDAYLGEEHAAHPGRGCPMPAVAGEAAVMDAHDLGTLVSRGTAFLRAQMTLVADGEIHEHETLALASLMVGGQILARATGDETDKAQILKACREGARGLLHMNGDSHVDG